MENIYRLYLLLGFRTVYQVYINLSHSLQFISVLIQGYPLRPATCPDLITLLSKRCSQMHNHIKSRSDESEWSVPERHNNNNNNYKSDKHGLYSLIGEVLGILKLQRSSSSDDCSGYDNCKNGEDFLIFLIVLVIYNSIRAVAATEELGICVEL